MVESAASIRRDRVDHQSRGKFFAIAATAMLLIVFVAFSRTFYFRAFVEDTDLTALLGQQSLAWHLVVHGLVLSLWFMIFCGQTWLVASRRIQWHRKLGVLGIGMAVAVCLSAVSTTILFIPRGLDAGFPIEAVTGIVVGNSLFQLLFVALVSLAFIWRHRPDVHKRLMYFAAVAIIGPAFSSGNQRPFGVLLESVLPPGIGVSTFLVGVSIAVVAIMLFDFSTTKRVHVATIVPSILFPLCEIVAVNSGATGWGQTYVDWLA